MPLRLSAPRTYVRHGRNCTPRCWEPLVKSLRKYVALTAIVFTVITWLALAPAASAAGDRPNTQAGATTASPDYTWVSDTIGSKTDVDYFRFTTSRATYGQLLLANLPGNYDLQVF